MSGSTSLILLSVAAVAAGLNIELKIQNDPQCKFKGQQCSSDLSSIIYCTAKNGNSYQITSCLNGRKCKTNKDGDYVCSRDELEFPETAPRNKTFTCHGEGFFPDGYSCSKGYICNSDGSFPELVCECPAGTVLKVWGCSRDAGLMEDCNCPSIDRCKTNWNPNAFGVECHPGYFYTCQGDPMNGFTTEVHKCPDGQQFLEGKCRGAMAAVAATAAAASVEEPVCKPYEPPCSPEANVKCSKKGEMLPHKVKRCYYYCDNGLKPNIRDCGAGSYFTCIYGQCGCVYDSNGE